MADNPADQDHAEAERFFDGASLVEPGAVQISKGRPDPEAETARTAGLWGGIARKP